MAKITLVNLPFERMYKDTKLKGVLHYSPVLSLAALGAGLLADNHEVKVFDMNLPENTLQAFGFLLEKMKPDFVGITFVTALFKEMSQVVNFIKSTHQEIITVGGGPHASAFPERTLEESMLDIAVIGEGDFVIKDIANRKPFEQIKGVGYKLDGKIFINPRTQFIDNLDALPYPAYHLFDIKRYTISKTLARFSPVAWIESSRGCVGSCIYCNKSVHGNRFRKKSPGRVVDEILFIKGLGFKEAHFTDDAFTTDIVRAKRICDLLIERKVNFPWTLITGIRANQVDYELFVKLKKAGCYRICIGIESGNQQILKNINKGVTLNQICDAVKWSKKAGVEVWGAFMIGLPGETEESMQDTIDLARRLPLDLAKMAILIPLPATPIFNEWEKAGVLKTKDWEKFCFYSPPTSIYEHPNLSWETIMKYYNSFYRGFYFSPSFLLRRIKNSIKNKTIFEDLKICLNMQWLPKKKRNIEPQ